MLKKKGNVISGGEEDTHEEASSEFNPSWGRDGRETLPSREHRQKQRLRATVTSRTETRYVHETREVRMRAAWGPHCGRLSHRTPSGGFGGELGAGPPQEAVCLEAESPAGASAGGPAERQWWSGQACRGQKGWSGGRTARRDGRPGSGEHGKAAAEGDSREADSDSGRQRDFFLRGAGLLGRKP